MAIIAPTPSPAYLPNTPNRKPSASPSYPTKSKAR